MTFLRAEGDHILSRPDFDLQQTLNTLTKPALEVAGPTPLLELTARIDLPYMLLSPYKIGISVPNGPRIEGVSNELIITNLLDVPGITRSGIDAQNLPFEDRSLSLVFASALPHFPRFSENFVAESHRVLERNGLLVWQWVNQEDVSLAEKLFEIMMLRQSELIFSDGVQHFVSAIFQKQD